tara:strand:+ start:215 stop:760 length:546 start_codon:yes stop_codon:yes gene_type:complete
MLGSINTGGFTKSQVDAMQDSNYFQRKGVAGVYDAPNPSAPRVTGSAPNFLQRFTEKMPKFGTDKEGKSFLDRFQSYRPKEETGQDKFYGELAKRMGAGTSGMAAPVAEGLTYMRDEKEGPTVVGGTPGSPGLLQTVGVPLAAAFICDIRTKEDIAPLCNSEVNDVLSECAYFVKNLNECS